MLGNQPGPAALRLHRQRLEPTEHGGALAAAPSLLDPLLDQARRTLVVRGGERMPYRLAKVPVVLVPARGQEVQLVRKFGAFAPQAAAQEVGEEVVVAGPPALVVQRDDEEVLRLQLLKHLLPVIAACEGVAQGGAHALNHGGPEQEPPHPFGLAFEDLLGQEVKDVTVATGESFYEARDVVAVAHGERG